MFILIYAAVNVMHISYDEESLRRISAFPLYAVIVKYKIYVNYYDYSL